VFAYIFLNSKLRIGKCSHSQYETVVADLGSMFVVDKFF